MITNKKSIEKKKKKKKKKKKIDMQHQNYSKEEDIQDQK